MTNIHLSQEAKDHLVRLKSKTGIKHWNVLCRWAFCISLAEPSVPPSAKIPADSNVEMTWQVFGGPYQHIYHALLKARCQKDRLGTSENVLYEQFRLHLHRGIGYLFADKAVMNISALLSKIVL